MASIRKRGNTYQIRVSCGYNFERKQIVKSMTYRPRYNMTEKQIQKEVKRQAILFEEKCKTGRFLNGNIKLWEFIEKWFSDYAKTQLKEKSIARYRALLPRINAHLGHIRIDKLEPYHFLEFYSKLSECGIREDFKYKATENFKTLMAENGHTKKTISKCANVSEFVINSCLKQQNISKRTAEKILEIIPNSLTKVEYKSHLEPKTIQHYHRFLSSVLNTAVEWQLIPFNPCKRVKPPKSEYKESACLDDVQVFSLINALDKESIKYKTMIMLFLYSGMRRGELCGLEWSDIDFKNNLVNISKSSLYLPGKGIFDDTTKNKYSERVIHIPKCMTALLKEYLDYKMKFDNNFSKSDKIFTGSNGKPIHPDAVTGWFHKFILKNKFPKISIHSLRHTNATLLIAKGTDIKTVANRLGHSSTSTTGNIYAHAIKSADAAAAGLLNTIFNFEKNQSIMDK